MNFEDLINKHRGFSKTSSLSEESRFNLTEDFLTFFYGAVPNKIKCLIDNSEEFAIISDIRNRERIIEDKEMIVLNSTNAKCGSKVIFDKNTWLVLVENIIIDGSHKSFVISKCNYNIKYQYSGKVYNIPSLIVDKTSVSGVKYSEYLVNRTGEIQWFISNDDVTKNITPNTRIIIDDIAYEVTRLDKVSYKGLIVLGCRETVKNIRDDNNIANNATNNEIVGDSILPLNSIKTFTANFKTKWVLSNGNAQILNQDDYNAVIKGLKVGSVDLIAGDSIKKINITNSIF